MTTTTTSDGTTTIEAPSDLPVIRMAREFAASPAQLFRAHTDPELFVRWIGGEGSTLTLHHWDARTAGSWRYVSVFDGEEYGFHGCVHTVREDRIVWTFTFEGIPDGVCLETFTFEDLGGGRTLLRSDSTYESFEARDGMLSTMESGVTEAYAQLDRLLAADAS
jgi:uncharacterized protein YndB with AHSA1/START domain